LLETSTVGTVRTPADFAVVTAVVSSSAATEGEARAANDTKIQRLEAAAAAAGVAAQDVSVNRSPTVVEMSGLQLFGASQAMSMDVDMRRPEEGAQATAEALVEARVRNIAQVATLERSWRDAGALAVARPSYQLTDPEAARRRARTDAIAAARENAQAYAATLGMRVVRVVRVTERVGLDMMGAFVSDRGMVRRLQSGAPSGPEVETQAIVGVDFALGPQ
jgi:hypothetical protein